MKAGLMRPPPYCTGPSTVPPSRGVGGRKEERQIEREKDRKKERKPWGEKWRGDKGRGRKEKVATYQHLNGSK